MNRTRTFALLGVLTGLLAPVGLFAYAMVRGSAPDPLAIFAAMALGGAATLGVAGWMIGKREDALSDSNVRLKRISQELRAQSITDPLTGIPNRRLLDDQLARELAQAIRYGTPLALVMVDIDHFKTLNDRYGHRVGDDVLRRVAGVLDQQKRAGDFVARYGGEEFVAILPHTNRSQAAAWAERVRRAIGEARVTAPDGGLAGATASFGVAELDPDAPEADRLVEAADAALYEAKRAGRDRVEVWTPKTTRPGLRSVV
jgi:diguanylate cyclase (GGDEF)-like protein